MSTATQPTNPTVYTYDNDFSAFVAVKRSGEIIEIDEEMFDYWLNVLPPKGMRVEVVIKGVPRRVSFLQAEGFEECTAYWREGARFFAQHTDIMNPYA